MSTKVKTAETKKYPRKAVPLILDKGDSEEVASRKFSALAPTRAMYHFIVRM